MMSHLSFHDAMVVVVVFSRVQARAYTISTTGKTPPWPKESTNPEFSTRLLSTVLTVGKIFVVGKEVPIVTMTVSCTTGPLRSGSKIPLV